MNILVILTIHSVACTLLALVLAARLTSQGLVEDYAFRGPAAIVMSVMSIALNVLFPYTKFVVTGYRWTWLLIIFQLCLVSAIIGYRITLRKNDEYADPVITGLFVAETVVFVCLMIFMALLMTGVLTYYQPESGETRMFLFSFMKSIPV